MANRRFEMYEIRQILQRLRLGETDRAIARSERVGRVKVASLRQVAAERGWLDPTGPLPDDAVLAERLSSAPRPPQSISSVEVYRSELLAWHAQGIRATTMHRRWPANMATRAVSTPCTGFLTVKPFAHRKPR